MVRRLALSCLLAILPTGCSPALPQLVPVTLAIAALGCGATLAPRPELSRVDERRMGPELYLEAVYWREVTPTTPGEPFVLSARDASGHVVRVCSSAKKLPQEGCRAFSR